MNGRSSASATTVPESVAPALAAESQPTASFPAPAITNLPPAIRALAYRDFRNIWLGAMTSSTGSWMQTVAQSWLVFTMTGSAFWLGLDGFLAMAPSMMFSLIGGVVADRVDRRKLLLFSQYSQMTYAFILATLVFTGNVQVWHILVLSFLTGTSQSFGGPAYMSLLPTLVAKQDIPNAVAFNAIQFNMARVIGPALAGLALYKFGSAMCFLLNGISFLAVIFSIYTIKPRTVGSQDAKGSILDGLRQGLSFVANTKVIWQLCVLAFSVAFLAIGMSTLLPVFTRTIFHGDEAVYSHLMSCVGLGAVAGAFVVALLSQLLHRGKRMLLGQVFCGLFIVLFAQAQTLSLSYFILFFGSMSMVTVFAVMSALVQNALPDEVRGRAISIYMLHFQAGMSLGGLTAGGLAQWLTPVLTLTINGALLSVVGIVLLLTRSKVSEL